jgi:hypothetical protein
MSCVFQVLFDRLRQAGHRADEIEDWYDVADRLMIKRGGATHVLQPEVRSLQLPLHERQRDR